MPTFTTAKSSQNSTMRYNHCILRQSGIYLCLKKKDSGASETQSIPCSILKKGGRKLYHFNLPKNGIGTIQHNSMVQAETTDIHILKVHHLRRAACEIPWLTSVVKGCDCFVSLKEMKGVQTGNREKQKLIFVHK